PRSPVIVQRSPPGSALCLRQQRKTRRSRSRDRHAAAVRHREDTRLVRCAEPVARWRVRVAARRLPALARASRGDGGAVVAVPARALTLPVAAVEVARPGRDGSRGRGGADRRWAARRWCTQQLRSLEVDDPLAAELV